MPISCRDNRFPEFIDHIVVDRRCCPGSTARPSARSRTAKRINLSGTSPPTTARCSWSCGSSDVAPGKQGLGRGCRGLPPPAAARDLRPLPPSPRGREIFIKR
jgi:hypothetical protein